METQIILLLLFALRTVSSQKVNIPPAPILPKLDVSSFPDYMQRLLANRPSLLYGNKPNHHEASNQNRDHMNTHISGENIGMPRTNNMKPINNRRYYLDKKNNVRSQPLFLSQGLRRPHTYGMNLRGDKGEIWNDISGAHLYINDFVPSKSIHPSLLHNKEDEPKSVSINNNIITPKHNNKYNQKQSVTIKPATLYATPSNLPENVATIGEYQKEQYKQQFPSTSVTTEKLETPTIPEIPEINKTTSEEMPPIVVRKDKTVNQFDENPSKLTRDLYYMTPQSLSEKIPANVDQQDNSAANPTVNEISTEIPKENLVNTSEKDVIPVIVDPQDNSAVNPTLNESSTEIPKENIVNTSDKDKVVQSFNDLSTNEIINKESINTRSPKTFGMKLMGDHGYVWNDLIKPGIHYNVGELKTADSINLTSEEEMNPFDNTKIAEEPSIQKTRPETSHIYKPTTEANNTNEDEKLSKNVASESGGFLKMYIEKLVKEEVAKQLQQNSTTTNAYRRNGSENKKEIAKVENKKENHYGSLIGNGKVTNIFVFYPNDKNIKSTVNDTTILSKPVNEILNDMPKMGINSNEPDETNILTADPTESPYMTITTEPIKQDTNSNKAMGIEKYKDNETTTQSTAVTSEVSVTTVHSTAIDIGNQTTENNTMILDDATKAKTSESTTVTATESSQDDITNSTVTENNSKDSSTESSLQEMEHNNNETKQAESVNNEESESTTNAQEFNITNDSVNSSIGTLNEDVDKSSNETQANKEPKLSTLTTNTEESNITNDSINSSIGTSNEDINKSSNEPQATINGKKANEEAELTTISSSAVGSTVTSKNNVTSEGTTTAGPAEVITTDIDSVNDSSDVKGDSGAASSNITLPHSDS